MTPPAVRIRPTRRRLAVLALGMLATSAAIAAHAAGDTAMADPDTARTAIDADGVRLEVAIDHATANRRLFVRYRVTNQGDGTLAVFDRGDALALATGKLVAGTVPMPSFERTGSDLVLRHDALPLPSPAPTVPATPLATTLAPGAAVDAGFEFDLSLAEDAERVRWCVGHAPFDEAAFTRTDPSAEVPLFKAPLDAADSQRHACTPWYSLADGRFATG